jgi:hypothetical protein
MKSAENATEKYLKGTANFFVAAMSLAEGRRPDRECWTHFDESPVSTAPESDRMLPVDVEAATVLESTGSAASQFDPVVEARR